MVRPAEQQHTPISAHTCHLPRTAPVLSLLQRCCWGSSLGPAPHCLDCSQMPLGRLGLHSFLGLHSCRQPLQRQHLLLQALLANLGCWCCCQGLHMRGWDSHAAAAAAQG